MHRRIANPNLFVVAVEVNRQAWVAVKLTTLLDET
jgi:hypothetical protein